jgi:hypothetical protein
MDEARICRLCRHWVSLWTIKNKGRVRARSGEERRSARGQCHRYAPRASALTQQWPWTKAYDTCGEFEPVDDERRGPGK